MTPTALLHGRIALVTGATRGIGRAVALAFAQAGAQLILTGRTSGALEEIDDEIRSAGGTAASPGGRGDARIEGHGALRA